MADETPTGNESIGPLTVCALLRGIRRVALKHRLQAIQGTMWGALAEAVANANGNGAQRLKTAMTGMRNVGMTEEATRRHVMAELIRFDIYVDDWLDLDEEFRRRRGIPEKTIEEVSGMFDETNWLWQDWIPKGYLSMICGRPGVGKSWVAAWLGANLINNGLLPDGGHAGEDPTTACVAWIDTEGTHSLLVQRLKQLGVSGGRFKWPLDPKHPSDPFPVVDFSEDYWMQVVMDYAIEKRPCWIVVDSLRGAHAKDENSSEVQTMLANTAAIARDVGCGFTYIHHLRKSNEWDGGEITLDMVRGSSAIAAMMRTVIAIDQPDASKKELRLHVIKSNLALIPEPIGIELRADGPATLDWTPSVPRPMSSSERACEFLLARLKDGPRPSTELLEESKQLGISLSSINKAKARLSVTAAKLQDHWEWSLPPKEGQVPF